MKSYLFLIFIAIGIVPCYSQDGQYRPFVEEGKVWKMKYVNVYPEYPNYDYCYYIEGDTLIANVACKKLYAYNRLNTGATEYQVALYEDNGIVYFIPMNSVVSYILYDFNVSADSTTFINSTVNPQEWPVLPIRNNADRQFCFNGTQRHSLLVNRESDYPALTPLGYNAGWWIEGVGSEVGPLNQWGFYLSGGTNYLMECEVNGEGIFKISELRKQSPFGDANVDGVVNINDLMQLVNYLVGQQTAGFIPIAADVNHTGHLSVEDVMFMVNIITKY